jgi:hypothetical protein
MLRNYKFIVQEYATKYAFQGLLSFLVFVDGFINSILNSTSDIQIQEFGTHLGVYPVGQENID